MTAEDDDFELVRGSGNVFIDLGLPDPEREQLRAILAAEIGKTLTAEKLTVRAAEKITGIAAADFSRIRGAKLSGFTIDRLMTILDRLDREVDVSVTFRARGSAGREAGVVHV
jgi:predicted XRE-type DNA-binding protein